MRIIQPSPSSLSFYPSSLILLSLRFLTLLNLGFYGCFLDDEVVELEELDWKLEMLPRTLCHALTYYGSRVHRDAMQRVRGSMVSCLAVQDGMAGTKKMFLFEGS